MKGVEWIGLNKHVERHKTATQSASGRAAAFHGKGFRATRVKYPMCLGQRLL